MLLTKLELDRMHCTTPGCNCGGESVVLTAGCHRGAGTEAEYREGILNLRCERCKGIFASIAVQAMPDMAPTSGPLGRS